MKSIYLISGIFLTLFITECWAGELPELTLNQGVNKISISVVNRWINDLSNVIITIDTDTLPEWLDVQSHPEPIHVPSGTKSQKKLYLMVNIKGNPDGAAEIPFTLIDDTGNTWRYTVPIRVIGGTPFEYALYANFPNPFNPSTTIRYSLKGSGHTKLLIYNALGQKTRTLVNEPQTGGMHTVQ